MAGLDSERGVQAFSKVTLVMTSGGAYIQGGPSAIFPDAGDKEVELTGKSCLSAVVLFTVRFPSALVMKLASAFSRLCLKFSF